LISYYSFEGMSIRERRREWERRDFQLWKFPLDFLVEKYIYYIRAMSPGQKDEFDRIIQKKLSLLPPPVSPHILRDYVTQTLALKNELTRKIQELESREELLNVLKRVKSKVITRNPIFRQYLYGSERSLGLMDRVYDPNNPARQRSLKRTLDSLARDEVDGINPTKRTRSGGRGRYRRRKSRRCSRR
jgi:hypothetical protein